MLRTFLKKNKKGFTLTELMIVVVIIGILTAIAIPIYSSVSKNAKTKACEGNQRVLKGAIAAYIANDGNVPTGINDLAPYLDPAYVDGTEEAPTVNLVCPVSGDAYELTGDKTSIVECTHGEVAGG